MPTIETTPEFVQSVYETTRSRLKVIRERLGRPLTLAEKVLFGHMADPNDELAIVATLRSPLFGVTDEELWLHRVAHRGFAYLRTVASSPSQQPWLSGRS